MGDGIGLKSFVGIGFQGATGSASIQTTSVHWIPLVSESVTEDIPPLESQTIRSRYDEPRSKQGPRVIGGDLVIEGDAHSLGVFFAAAFGITSTTSGANGIDSHVMTLTQSAWSNKAPLQPLTLLISRDTGSQFTYFDCYASKVNLSLAHDEILGATMSVVGLGYTKASLETPAYAPSPTGQPMCVVSSIAGFTTDDGSDTFNRVETYEYEVENGLEARGMLTTDNGPNRVKRSGFRTIRVRQQAIYETLNAAAGSGIFDEWQEGTGGSITTAQTFIKMFTNSESFNLTTGDCAVRALTFDQSPGQLMANYELWREDPSPAFDTCVIKTESLGFNTYGNGTVT